MLLFYVLHEISTSDTEVVLWKLYRGTEAYALMPVPALALLTHLSLKPVTVHIRQVDNQNWSVLFDVIPSIRICVSLYLSPLGN